jgi:CHAP domain
MRYPGRVIKMGETDARVVRALKTQLNKLLALAGEQRIVLDEANPVFGVRVKQAVQLFQARHVDDGGRPLKPDGEVGAITWGVLFGPEQVSMVLKPADKFLGEALAVALAEEAKKIREVPPNSNRGRAVEAYLASVGLGAGNPWCAAFTYWCFEQAAIKRERANPMVRTGGCLAHWNGAAAKGAQRITKLDAVNNPALLKPGMLFIMDFGGGKGHTGFVVAVRGGMIDTVEGNTDASKTREGGGVYKLTRKLAEVNKGYINYAGV